MRLTKLSFALVTALVATVGVGVVAVPANAVGGPAASIDQSTFAPSSPTQSFTITVPSSGASITNWLEIYVSLESVAHLGWPPSNTCNMGAAAALSTCKVNSVSVGGSTVTDAVVSKMGSMISLKRPLNGQTQQFFTSNTNNEVVISFAPGAFTAPATSGTNYQASVSYNGTGAPSITPAPISVTAISQTVTFDANGGTGSISAQTASQQTALTSNNGSITRTGYNFTGWNTAANGSGTAYADGAQYSFGSSTTLYAQWTAAGGGSSNASNATLTLNLAVGQAVAGAPVDINVTGMQAGAAWDTTVRSTPVSIGTGTIASGGALSQTLNLPSALDAGWHTITFTSTDAGGNSFTSVAYFEVSATGTLLSTSTTKPAGLAETGADVLVPFGAAATLLLVGAAITMIRRRKAA